MSSSRLSAVEAFWLHYSCVWELHLANYSFIYSILQWLVVARKENKLNCISSLKKFYKIVLNHLSYVFILLMANMYTVSQKTSPFSLWFLQMLTNFSIIWHILYRVIIIKNECHSNMSYVPDIIEIGQHL